MPPTKAVVVILNFNGKKFLEKFLPDVVRNSAPYPVVVVDNDSKDDSVQYIQSQFPDLRIIQTGGNLGYAGGYNHTLSQIDSTYYILLNNDVATPAGWIEPVLKDMDGNSSIGACQPLLLDESDHRKYEYAGAAGGFIDRYGYPFCRGRLFNTIESIQPAYQQSMEIFWASGACMFVRASAFRQAGGFDASYFAHMEEIDLCWRMKNLGHTIWLCADSEVYHVGGGTLHKVSPTKTFLNFRNNLATLLKNHRGATLLPKIIFRLILDGVAAIKFLFEGQASHFGAVFKAHFAFYARIPAIFKERYRLMSLPGFRHSMNRVYKANIVMEYYIRKKRTFSDLNRGFFSE